MQDNNCNFVNQNAENANRSCGCNNGPLNNIFGGNGCGCGCGDSEILFFIIIFLLLFTNFGCCRN